MKNNAISSYGLIFLLILLSANEVFSYEPFLDRHFTRSPSSDVYRELRTKYLKDLLKQAYYRAYPAFENDEPIEKIGLIAFNKRKNPFEDDWNNSEESGSRLEPFNINDRWSQYQDLDFDGDDMKLADKEAEEIIENEDDYQDEGPQRVQDGINHDTQPIRMEGFKSLLGDRVTKRPENAVNLELIGASGRKATRIGTRVTKRQSAKFSPNEKDDDIQFDPLSNWPFGRMYQTRVAIRYPVGESLPTIPLENAYLVENDHTQGDHDRISKKAGFGARVTKKGNFGARVTKKADFGARVTKRAGFGSRVTKKAGFGARVTKKAGFGARVTKKAGFGARVTKKDEMGARVTRNICLMNNL